MVRRDTQQFGEKRMGARLPCRPTKEVCEKGCRHRSCRSGSDRVYVSRPSALRKECQGAGAPRSNNAPLAPETSEHRERARTAGRVSESPLVDAQRHAPHGLHPWCVLHTRSRGSMGRQTQPRLRWRIADGPIVPDDLWPRVLGLVGQGVQLAVLGAATRSLESMGLAFLGTMANTTILRPVGRSEEGAC